MTPVAITCDFALSAVARPAGSRNISGVIAVWPNHASTPHHRAEPTIVISRILSLEQAQRELAKGLYLLLKLGQHQPRDLDTIAYLLKQAPGNCPVFLTIRDAGKRDCVLRLGREFSINPSKYAHDELEAILGSGSVKLA